MLSSLVGAKLKLFKTGQSYRTNARLIRTCVGKLRYARYLNLLIVKGAKFLPNFWPKWAQNFLEA